MIQGTVQTSTFSWNSRLSRHLKAGDYEMTLKLFQQMQKENMDPDSFTFVSALTACSKLRAIEVGRCVHDQILQNGFESDIFVGNSLVDMYSKCGSIEDAWKVFNKISQKNVVLWNAMILGFVKCGHGQKALELYGKMQQERLEPDPNTFVVVLKACASVSDLEEGRRVHEQIIQSDCQAHFLVGSSLINMYSKCGSIENAFRVFSTMQERDVVSWSIMILGFVDSGHSKKALKLFQQMLHDGFKPDPVTFVGVIGACAHMSALEEGRAVHEQIVKQGYEIDVFVGSSLVDMYAKCGRIEEALGVFNKMITRNVVSWNAMILGYVKCGEAQKALDLSRQMHQEGVQPDAGTFLGIINACAMTEALEEGRYFHKQIIQSGCGGDAFLGSSLIDMYARCASFDDALTVFNNMPVHNSVTWSAMLGAYAMHGCGTGALKHLERMHQEGVQLDAISFVSLLSACSHLGLLDEGLHFFECMSPTYRVTARMEHYACIVDLLGRAGHLHQALDLIKTLPFQPNITVWMSILGACRVHGNVEIGDYAATQCGS